MTPLTRSALDHLGPVMSTPSYDPARVSTGIVHFGVGNFHRAHEAMYVEALLSQGHLDWGICGVGVLAHDASMRDALTGQDQLYTLVTAAPDGTTSAQIVAAITEFLFAPDNPGAVVAKLADPRTRIVSLTITEGGYGINDSTGLFEPHDCLTLADLAGSAHPQSTFGFLAAGLRARRDAGVAPFTVMSCDNIQGNGSIARHALLEFIGRTDPSLVEWVAHQVAFPNSMVDRITPATTDATRNAVEVNFGLQDRWPVRAESYTQWVLEDNFSNGRPPFEAAGVQLVDRVEPYELMKLRLLNAAHQAMCYLGILEGETWVHEVCRDPQFAAFLLGYMHQEAIPTLPPVPGIDLNSYCEQLIDRFTSDAIEDTLARQAVDGSERIPKFLLPVVRAQLQSGGPIGHAALVLAAWSLFLQKAGKAAATRQIDPRLVDLQAAAEAERQEPGAFLKMSAVFGDLAHDARLNRAFTQARSDLLLLGVRSAMAKLN